MRNPGLAGLAGLVRDAQDDDYDAYGKLFPELGTDDPIAPKERWVAEIKPGILVLEEAGQITGYAYWKRLGEDVYVFNIVVAKTSRGRGRGRALMMEIAKRARAEGFTRWQLNVKVDNVPAISLYSSLGFATAYASCPMRFPWAALSALPTDKQEIQAQIVEPNDDAALEVAFGLPRGRIHELRLRAGWVMMRLVDETKPDETRLGFACFNPSFPGAFPFRVVRPSLARVLLEAIQPHALPEHQHVGIVVEDDAALKQQLLDVGANVRFELLHMTGSIPELG